MAIDYNTAMTPMDFAGMAKLKNEAKSGNDGKALSEAAQQFESLFVQMMLKSMRDAVPDGGLMGGNNMDMYQDMHDKQIALDISRRGGLGLAKMIEAQLQGPAVDKALTDKTDSE